MVWQRLKTWTKRTFTTPNIETGDCPTGGKHISYEDPVEQMLGDKAYQCDKCGRIFRGT